MIPAALKPPLLDWTPCYTNPLHWTIHMLSVLYILTTYLNNDHGAWTGYIFIYLFTLVLLKYSETLKHNTSAPELFSFSERYCDHPIILHLSNGTAASTTHSEPPAPPDALGSTTTWQHPREY